MLARIAIATCTALFALLTASYAATGRLPLVPAPTQARAVALTASGPLVTNSREGSAILGATDMAPGSSVTGDVTIGNDGDRSGSFALSLNALDDSATPTGALSASLILAVDDITPGRVPALVFHGALQDLLRRGSVAAGDIGPGARRTYRLTVAFPAGRAPAVDNPLQGSSTSASFLWRAVAEDDPVLPPAVPTPAGAAPPAWRVVGPRVRLRAVARQRLRGKRVRATVGCSARCRVTVTVTRRGARGRPVRLARRTFTIRTAAARPVALALRGSVKGRVRLTASARIAGRTVVVGRSVTVAP